LLLKEFEFESSQKEEVKKNIRVVMDENDRLHQIIQDMRRGVGELQNQYGRNENRANWADAMEERAKQLEAELI